MLIKLKPGGIHVTQISVPKLKRLSFACCDRHHSDGLAGRLHYCRRFPTQIYSG